MDSGFITACMSVFVVMCCLRPVRCRRLFTRLQHCRVSKSDWVSKKHQYSLCIGETEDLGFLTCIPFRSPLKVKRVDEIIDVNKEIQRVRRERAAKWERGKAAARDEGQTPQGVSVVVHPSWLCQQGPGMAEPGFHWCGCWGAGLPRSSSKQAGERHRHEGLPEQSLILVE